MDVETEPIHFTQDDHHSIQERPTHDAPIGSRTPAATGEDARKEWKVLVTFSFFSVQRLHGFRQVLTHVQSQQKDEL